MILKMCSGQKCSYRVDAIPRHFASQECNQLPRLLWEMNVCGCGKSWLQERRMGTVSGDVDVNISYTIKFSRYAIYVFAKYAHNKYWWVHNIQDKIKICWSYKFDHTIFLELIAIFMLICHSPHLREIFYMYSFTLMSISFIVFF